MFTGDIQRVCTLAASHKNLLGGKKGLFTDLDGRIPRNSLPRAMVCLVSDPITIDTCRPGPVRIYFGRICGSKGRITATLAVTNKVFKPPEQFRMPTQEG
jgi:hypothetical protein